MTSPAAPSNKYPKNKRKGSVFVIIIFWVSVTSWWSGALVGGLKENVNQTDAPTTMAGRIREDYPSKNSSNISNISHIGNSSNITNMTQKLNQLHAEVEEEDEEEDSMFVLWGDDDNNNKNNKNSSNGTGIDINNILLYLKYKTSDDILHQNNEYWLSDTFLLPILIGRNKKTKKIHVQASRVRSSKMKGFLRKDRIGPTISGLRKALNEELPRFVASNNYNKNNDTKSNKKRLRAKRLYEALYEKDVQIPIMFNFGDTKDCGHDYVEHTGKFIQEGWGTHGMVRPQNTNHSFLDLPIFSYSRPSTCHYALPFPAYTNIKAAKNNSQEWDDYFLHAHQKYPWHQKINKAVWRGSMTGTIRKRFMRRPLKRMNSSLFDFEVVGGKNKSNAIPFEDFQHFKLILDFDGNSWSERFAKLLCLNSVVIKTQPEDLDFFTPTLTPWKHYVPGFANTSLETTVKYCLAKEHEPQMLQIVQNANAWCRKHMVQSQMQRDIIDIVASYLQLLNRHDPQWHDTTWKSSSQPFLEALDMII